MSENSTQKITRFQTRNCRAIQIQIQCVTLECPEARGIETLLLSASDTRIGRRDQRPSLDFNFATASACLGFDMRAMLSSFH